MHTTGLTSQAKRKLTFKMNEQDEKETPLEEAINEKLTNLTNKKETGIVKWFNVKKGYGFIIRNDTKEELFVHRRDIIKTNTKKTVAHIWDDEVVEFDVVQNKQGNKAINVTGKDGRLIIGSSYVAYRKRGKLSERKETRPPTTN